MTYPNRGNFDTASQDSAWWTTGSGATRVLRISDGYTVAPEIQKAANRLARATVREPMVVIAGSQRNKTVVLPGASTTPNTLTANEDGVLDARTLTVLYYLARTRGLAREVDAIEEDLRLNRVSKTALEFGLTLLDGNPATVSENVISLPYGRRPGRPSGTLQPIRTRPLPEGATSAPGTPGASTGTQGSSSSPTQPPARAGSFVPPDPTTQPVIPSTPEPTPTPTQELNVTPRGDEWSTGEKVAVAAGTLVILTAGALLFRSLSKPSS